MAVMEMDGMTVDQIIYWWDQPVVYLGRIQGEDDRPCLVLLVDDSGAAQVYHRMRFADERGMRATLASGCSPTLATYELAQDLARLAAITGDEPWIAMTREELVALDGPPTSLPPGRSTGDIAMRDWGIDHWTLLRHLAARDRAAEPGSDPAIEYQRLRINPENHVIQTSSEWPGEAAEWGEGSGTRLKNYADDPQKVVPTTAPREEWIQVVYHDDIDCLEEFEAEGLLDILSTAKGTFRMTEAGLSLARLIEDHVASGRAPSEFDPTAQEPDGTATNRTQRHHDRERKSG